LEKYTNVIKWLLLKTVKITCRESKIRKTKGGNLHRHFNSVSIMNRDKIKLGQYYMTCKTLHLGPYSTLLCHGSIYHTNNTTGDEQVDLWGKEMLVFM
jgi:hypothetical protein